MKRITTALDNIRPNRIQTIAIIAGLTLAATDPVAAAGACDVPNASNGIGTAGDLIRSVLVLAGVGVAAKSLMSSQSGGSHGKAGSRKTMLSAAGLFFVGAAAPQLSDWVLGLFGSSMSAVGLGCMF